MKYIDQNAGIRICDFSTAVPSEWVSREFTAGAWHLVDYNTTGGSGTMLASRPGFIPHPVEMPLQLEGWHRLYVCLESSSHSMRAGLSLKLTRDAGPSFFGQSSPAPENVSWGGEEMCSEHFWQCADLTGQTLTIQRLQNSSPETIALMWVRAIPMSPQEVIGYLQETKTTGTLHAHSDMDWLDLVPDASKEDLFAPLLQDIVKSDIGVMSVEIHPMLYDYSILEDYERRGVLPYIQPRLLRGKEYADNRAENLTYLTREAHRSGVKIYAALRTAFTQWPFPRDMCLLSPFRFVEEHPEFFCLDRDGEPYHSLSFAFREVRDYAINELLKLLPYGFDGVTVFTHRGMMTLFEAPVLELFEELYPGVDPRRLPLSDERLVQVHCRIMGEFIRELRLALDRYSEENHCERKAVNIITGFSCSECKLYGIDVESWAENGWIDSFIPANMSVWVEDSRYRDDQNPELIDLEKYKEAKYRSLRCPVRRFYETSLEKMLENLPHHLEISRRTGVKCYFELPWECCFRAEGLWDYISKMYAAGAENLSLWDCYHVRVMHRDEWNLVSRAGHKEMFTGEPLGLDSFMRSYRLLSFNGNSLASYHPAWRG